LDLWKICWRSCSGAGGKGQPAKAVFHPFTTDEYGLVPTFRSSLIPRSALSERTSERHGRQQTNDSSAAFRFEAPEPTSPPALQALQIGGARIPCVRQITTIETIF
jgi:hypothetical protein